MLKSKILLFILFFAFDVYSQSCGPESDSQLNEIEKIVSKVQEAGPVFDPLFCEGLQECERYDGDDTVSASCTRAEEELAHTRGNLKKNKSGDCGLTSQELAAVGFYTGSGYECLNNYLRKSLNNKAIKRVVESLNSGLSKLPNYQSFVERGADLPTRVRSKHKEGKMITYKAFTSSSTDNGFSGADRFIIMSLTGKPIMGFSSFSHENEVLFKSGTKFKILKVEHKENPGYEGGKEYLYVMKEVSGVNSRAEEEVEDKKFLARYLEIKNDENYFGIRNTWSCPLDSTQSPVKSISREGP